MIGDSATYGKGKIQSVYELADGSALFVTIARYKTPVRTTAAAVYHNSSLSRNFEARLCSVRSAINAAGAEQALWCCISPLAVFSTSCGGRRRCMRSIRLE